MIPGSYLRIYAGKITVSQMIPASYGHHPGMIWVWWYDHWNIIPSSLEHHTIITGTWCLKKEILRISGAENPTSRPHDSDLWHPCRHPPAPPPPAPPPAPPRQKKILLLLLLLLPTCYYFVSMCSSSLSLITFSCVSILTLQWLSSPHILVQHGLSHDILQWLKKLKGFRVDSDNPIFYIYI